MLSANNFQLHEPPLISDYDCVMHNEIGSRKKKTREKKRKRLKNVEKKGNSLQKNFFEQSLFFIGCYFYLFLPFVQFCDVRTKQKSIYCIWPGETRSVLSVHQN